MNGPRFTPETRSGSHDELDLTTGQVMTDDAGHRWPITGHWCESCGMPMHAVCVPFGTHPGCDGRPS